MQVSVRYNHYMPQLLLNNWDIGSQRILCYNKLNPIPSRLLERRSVKKEDANRTPTIYNVYKPVPSKSNGGEIGLYYQETEEWFNQVVETAASQVLVKFKSLTRGYLSLTKSQHEDLARFVATLFVRTPKIRYILSRCDKFNPTYPKCVQHSELARMVNRKIIEPLDVSIEALERYREFNHQFPDIHSKHDYLIKIFYEMSPLLTSRAWRVLKNNSALEFITSDVGVMYFREFYLAPLSPEYTVVISDRDTEQYGSKLIVQNVNKHYAQKQNAVFAQLANQYVYGKTPESMDDAIGRLRTQECVQFVLKYNQAGHLLEQHRSGIEPKITWLE